MRELLQVVGLALALYPVLFLVVGGALFLAGALVGAVLYRMARWAVVPAVVLLLVAPVASAQPLCGEHVLRPPGWTTGGQPIEVRLTVEEVRPAPVAGLQVVATFRPWPGRAQVRACLGETRCSGWAVGGDHAEAERRHVFGLGSGRDGRGIPTAWGPEGGPVIRADRLEISASYHHDLAASAPPVVGSLATCALSHTVEWQRVRSTSYTYWRGFREDRWSLPPGRYRATLRGERGDDRLPGQRAQVSMVALVVGGRQEAALIYQQDSTRWLLDRPGAGGVEVDRGAAVDGVVVELGELGGEILVRWGFCCACAPAVCAEGGWFTPPQGWEAAVVLERARR